MPNNLKTLGITDKDHKGFIEFANNAKEAFNFNPIPIDNNSLLMMLK